MWCECGAKQPWLTGLAPTCGRLGAGCLGHPTHERQPSETARAYAAPNMGQLWDEHGSTMGRFDRFSRTGRSASRPTIISPGPNPRSVAREQPCADPKRALAQAVPLGRLRLDHSTLAS
jgi:hypothetical protein